MVLLILIGIGVVIYLVSESDKKKHSTYSNPYDTPSSSTKPYRKNRATHCHSCKSSLTSANDEECSSCDWLICPNCGACEYSCSKSKSKSKSKTNKAISLGTAAVVASSISAKDTYTKEYEDNEVFDTFSDYDNEEYESRYDYESDIDTSVDEGYAEEIDWEDRY